MEIKRGTWFYELFVGDSYKERQLGDFCAITSRVFWLSLGFVIVATIGLVVVGLTFFGVGDLIGWIAAMLQYGAFIRPNEGAAVVLGVLAVSGVAAAIVFIVMRLSNIADSQKVRAVYGAISGKYCTKVTFKD